MMRVGCFSPCRLPPRVQITDGERIRGAEIGEGTEGRAGFTNLTTMRDEGDVETEGLFREMDNPELNFYPGLKAFNGNQTSLSKLNHEFVIL